MTRWARSGNSQKHRKMPGDATPWEKLSKSSSGKSANSNPEFERNYVKKEHVKTGKYNMEINTGFVDSNGMNEKSNNNQEFKCLGKKQNCQNITELNETAVNVSSDNVNKSGAVGNKVNNVTEKKAMSKAQKRRAKKKIKLQEIRLKNLQSNNLQKEANSKEQASNKIITTDGSSSSKDFSGKKKLFLERLQERRKQNGITLLPSNVERKLYNIKRKLREKGMSPEQVKEIIRKERRSEELKFRKTFSTKTCFNCRQIGHILADCPCPMGTSDQLTGICFKCGSTKHTSYKCSKKVQGYPLATCFVCKEQGHISKDCPRNERGIYPDGGKCKLCGNVNHLGKDCPTLIKKTKEENTFVVHTINEGTSIDAEIGEETRGHSAKKKKSKQLKIVKF